MPLTPNDYHNRVCLNVLPGSKQQAVVEGHIEIDVRSVTAPQLDQIQDAIANLVQENR